MAPKTIDQNSPEAIAIADVRGDVVNKATNMWLEPSNPIAPPSQQRTNSTPSTIAPVAAQRRTER